MKPLETPSKLGYKSLTSEVPIPMVKSVDILGKVVERPRLIDTRSNPRPRL